MNVWSAAPLWNSNRIPLAYQTQDKFYVSDIHTFHTVNFNQFDKCFSNHVPVQDGYHVHLERIKQHHAKHFGIRQFQGIHHQRMEKSILSVENVYLI